MSACCLAALPLARSIVFFQMRAHGGTSLAFAAGAMVTYSGPLRVEAIDLAAQLIFTYG